MVKTRHVDAMAKKTLVKIDAVNIADILAFKHDDATSWLAGKVCGVWKSRISSVVDLSIASMNNPLTS